MRLFLDANILFLAGYSPTSPVHDLLALEAAGLCTLITSAYALEEASRNLAAKGPVDWAAPFDAAQARIGVVGEAAAAALEAAAASGVADPADVPILAAAIQARADGLVTGDRRAFGALFDRTVQGVAILTLRQAFLRVLDDSTSR